MEAPSVRILCEQLISLAIQRCLHSAYLCRLSVDIRRSQLSDPHTIQISISDTGTGSTLKEFYALKYTSNGVYGGVISVITTYMEKENTHVSFYRVSLKRGWMISRENLAALQTEPECTTDDEIYHYKLNLNETSSSRRTTRLPSTSKNNAIFSGTEVSLSCTEDMDAFVTYLTRFFQKMLILKPHNIAAELMADIGDHPELQQHKVIMAYDIMCLPLGSSSIALDLTARLEEYIHKHGLYSSEKCQSCFPNSEHIKIGNGVAMPENHMGKMTVEAVIIISELSETSNCTCSTAHSSSTEVLYFKEYSPSLIHPSILNTLKSISWDNFGLALSSITTHDGCAVLEWDNLPLNAHIDIAIHCYSNQYDAPPSKKIARLEGKLIKTSVYAALNDLKEKYKGYLLSAHTLKIHSYAPDLARSIAGLISSSEDYDFQGECYSLLGLELESITADCVEKCIKDKIISALEMNDRKASGFHDPALSLFEAYSDLQEPNYMDYDYEEGEEGYSFVES